MLETLPEFLGLSLTQLLASVAITLFAGLVKGAIGFAMPLIMISLLGSVMVPALALAALILPVTVTNLQQALRQGPREAWDSGWAYRRFILWMAVFIFVGAQMVLILPQGLLLGLLGVPVTLYALVQLAGRSLRITIRRRGRAEAGLGAVAGFYGGMSGVWGPPLLVYLISMNVEKRESVRIQGVVYMLGGLLLIAAHAQSGVLNAQTLPLSAALLVPALAGMWIGFRLQDRMDANRFRFWTLVLLAVSGLNLVRRAVMG